jgi:hypothetical protein
LKQGALVFVFEHGLHGTHLCLTSFLTAQMFMPWTSLLVNATDPYNPWPGRKPLLPLMLEKGIIQPQDVLVINQVRS